MKINTVAGSLFCRLVRQFLSGFKKSLAEIKIAEKTRRKYANFCFVLQSAFVLWLFCGWVWLLIRLYNPT